MVTVNRSRTLILLAVVLVALNMRGAIVAVPPLLGEITTDLGISQATAGLLTSLPVLFFAIAAPFSAALGRRLGPGHAVMIGLGLILIGTVTRVLGGSWILFAGTAVLGLGVTIANILVPVVIKRDFKGHASRVTGYFVATMAVGATITAAFAVPLADWLGWRAALASWAILIPVAALGWWLHVTRDERTSRAQARVTAETGVATHTPSAGADHSDGYVWRLPIAWALALTMGTQSALFYSMTTWLPTILTERSGLSPAVAGTALSVFQITAIPTALTVAALCRMRPTQGWIGVMNATGWIVFIVGLLVLPGLWPVWTLIGGLTQGGGFTYALTLMVLRGADENVVRAFGAMGQLVGYLIGAAGPFIAGWLAQTTGAWTAPGVFLVTLAVIMGTASLMAGRNETVHAPGSAPGR